MDITLFLIALGLSMDAFSVAVSNGLCMNGGIKDALKTGLFFGVFQGIMPFLGFLGGTFFAAFIERIDHWIAFFLLSFIGIKMIKEALEKIKNPSEIVCKKIDNKTLLIQAIATSIDAFAVGISFAALNINIIEACIFIMSVTFILSFAGFFIGKKVGGIFKEKAEIAGGIILIFIGIKILIEHLFGI